MAYCKFWSPLRELYTQYFLSFQSDIYIRLVNIVHFLETSPNPKLVGFGVHSQQLRHNEHLN